MTSLGQAASNKLTSEDLIRLKKYLADNLLRALENEGIPIAARDVGEGFTRKVIFRVHTGEALVRRLKAQEPGTSNGR